jgi:peroxiredoxin
MNYIHREGRKGHEGFERKRRMKNAMRSLKFLCLFCALCVLRGECKAQQIQQTPSVLLPEKYLENVRAPLKVGSDTPDFTLPRCAYDGSTPGTMMQLSKWRDAKKSNGAIIIFWAFWCDTWKDVTRDLNALKAPLSEMNVQILAVAVDASQQPVARRAFEKKRIWWPVVIDGKSEASAAWGVRRVPTVFVVDKDGKVQKVFEGFPGRQTFVRETATALNIKIPQQKKAGK